MEEEALVGPVADYDCSRRKKPEVRIHIPSELHFGVDKVTGDVIEVPGKSSYAIDLIESARAAVIKAAAESNGASPERRAQLSSDEAISELNQRYLEKKRYDALMNKAGKRRSWTADEIRRGLAVQDEGKTWDADTEDIIYHERSKTYRVVPRYPGGVQDAWRYQYDDEEVVEAFVVDQVEEPIAVKPKGPTKMDPFWIQRGGKRIARTCNGDPIPEGLEFWYNGDLSKWRWDPEGAREIEQSVLDLHAKHLADIEEGYKIMASKFENELQDEIVENRQFESKLTNGIMLASGTGTFGIALATQNTTMMPVALALLGAPLIASRKKP